MKMINQLINIFWSAIGFSVIIIHWYSAWEITWFVISLLLSTSIIIFPLRFLQMSVSRKFYERLGVRMMKKVVQNGTWINKMSRRIDPSHRIITRNKRLSFLKTTEMYERFHWMCMVFFMLSAVHALYHTQYIFALLIAIINIAYNIYPIMLQQYNRLRMVQVTKKYDFGSKYYK